MTTAAMVLGVVPLITASGAGAASRFNMGLVIATGLSIGTLFTLFVVPAVYLLLAADRSKLSRPTRRKRRRHTPPQRSETRKWKTGTRGNTSSSRTSAPGRRAISWRKCRCKARAAPSISVAGRVIRPSFWWRASRRPK